MLPAAPCTTSKARPTFLQAGVHSAAGPSTSSSTALHKQYHVPDACTQSPSIATIANTQQLVGSPPAAHTPGMLPPGQVSLGTPAPTRSDTSATNPPLLCNSQVLGLGGLTMMSTAAIIGSGIFVLTGKSVSTCLHTLLPHAGAAYSWLATYSPLISFLQYSHSIIHPRDPQPLLVK